jgi:hypothetical protein
VASALANDPSHFLERNAKLQWGIMVCVYGMSHVPALLLLSFPGYEGKSAFLVFFLVFVVQTCMLVQHLISRRTQRTPFAPNVSRSFNWTSWGIGIVVASLVGALFSFITPFKFGAGAGHGGHRLRRRLDGAPGDEGAQARPRHSELGQEGRGRDRCERPAGPRRCAVLRGAHLLPLGPLVLQRLTDMRILGIDPGLQTTGFGVVDADGHALRYVASGTISTRTWAAATCRRA